MEVKITLKKAEEIAKGLVQRAIEVYGNTEYGYTIALCDVTGMLHHLFKLRTNKRQEIFLTNRLWNEVC